MLFGKTKKRVTSDVRFDVIAQEIDRSAQFSNDLLKWFLASLLLLNGGALIALLRLPEVSIDMIRPIGWPFALALTLTIVSGFLLALGSGFAALSLSEKVWSGDEFEHEKMEFVFEKNLVPGAFSAFGILGSLIATGCFIFGCFNFAYLDEVANETRLELPAFTIEGIEK